MQLIRQQPVVKEVTPTTPGVVDTKAATRAEAALTQLLVGEQERDLDVSLTTTFITSIETFQSNLDSPDDVAGDDEELQQKLMVLVFN